jgi:hypothetical protein
LAHRIHKKVPQTCDTSLSLLQMIYPAGVRFSCISQVSPVYTIGVWIARNLPP